MKIKKKKTCAEALSVSICNLKAFNMSSPVKMNIVKRLKE
jgi:hypothetical protein